MLDELIDAVTRETLFPEVVSERCVHAAVETASCRACVDSCPRDAWQLDDECLGLGVEACDGCGLCAAACPEGAVTHRHDAELRDVDGNGTAFWGCEEAGLQGAGIVPCVHAAGLRDLLAIHKRGISEVVTATGDCDQCPRGGKVRIAERIERVNALLADRGLATFGWRQLSPGDWAAVVDGHPRAARGPARGRRGFLSAGLRELGKYSHVPQEDVPSGHVEAPALMVAGASPRGLAPFVPAIDVERCSGCNACVSVCPHGAIAIESDDDLAVYLIDAARCTGCGLCVDLCDDDAVHVASWQRPTQLAVELREARCRACGNAFEKPVSRAPEETLCHVCRRINHYRHLHQVLD